MIKSFKALEDLTIGKEAYPNAPIKVAKDEIVYLDDEKWIDGNVFDASDDWKTVASEEVITVETEIIKEINGVTADNQKVVVVVDVDSASVDAVMLTGTTILVELLDSNDTVIDFKNITLGEIAKGSGQTEEIAFAGLVGSETGTIKTTVTFVAPDTTSYQVDMTVEAFANTNPIAGVIFDVGASVAATNPIVTNIKIIDSDGNDVTGYTSVEVFVVDAVNDPSSVTTLAMGTDGELAATIEANKAFVCYTIDGSIDISAIDAEGTKRLAVKFPDGKVYISSNLVWTA